MMLTGRVFAALLLLAAAAPAKAVDTSLETELQAAIELTQAREWIRMEDYAGALPLLEAARARQPDSADIQSLLGFVTRKLGRLPEAHAYYGRALALDPAHRAAYEYLGELHLQEGDTAAAEAVLKRLTRLCPSGCEERDELAAAIQSARNRSATAR